MAEPTDWMWCYENPKEAAAEIDKLRRLAEFADHVGNCVALLGEGLACTCGYEAARAALAE